MKKDFKYKIKFEDCDYNYNRADITYLEVTDHKFKDNKCLYFEVGDENNMAELDFECILRLKALIDKFVEEYK